MIDALLIWALPVAIAVHNAEEAVWLPAWPRRRAVRLAGRVTPGAFRFAVAVLTLAAFGVAAWAWAAGPGSLGHYLLAAYALAQALNIVFPHLLATLVTRSYAPGLLSGVVLVGPAAARLLYRGFTQGSLEPARFYWTAAVFVPAMLLGIPLLFALGRVLERALAWDR